ncbi:MAG: hypothetical protein HPY45_06825 [Anaerolineae bacterium]|nr:hypothetical protein [Anaerolineae bacterium]
MPDRKSAGKRKIEAQLGLSALWLWLLLFHPAAWMVCWLGFSMRQGVAGEADVYAIAGLACVLPWQAQAAAMLGLELWRRWWSYRKLPGYMPALPGLLLGAFGYWLVRVVLLET